MKTTDIALLIIIISVSAGGAFLIGNQTIGKSNQEPIAVKTVESISEEVTLPSESVFKEGGINPTVEATISGDNLTSVLGEQSQTELSDDSQSQTQNDSDDLFLEE